MRYAAATAAFATTGSWRGRRCGHCGGRRRRTVRWRRHGINGMPRSSRHDARRWTGIIGHHLLLPPPPPPPPLTGSRGSIYTGQDGWQNFQRRPTLPRSTTHQRGNHGQATPVAGNVRRAATGGPRWPRSSPPPVSQCHSPILSFNTGVFACDTWTGRCSANLWPVGPSGATAGAFLAARSLVTPGRAARRFLRPPPVSRCHSVTAPFFLLTRVYLLVTPGRAGALRICGLWAGAVPLQAYS